MSKTRSILSFLFRRWAVKQFEEVGSILCDDTDLILNILENFSNILFSLAIVRGTVVAYFMGNTGPH